MKIVSVQMTRQTSGVIAAAALTGALYLAALMGIHQLAGFERVPSAAPLNGATNTTDYADVGIETADETLTSFAATNGRVRVASMFYSHCPGLCPLTIEVLQRMEQQLTSAQRTKLTVILLSLDPERDSPAVLRQFEAQRHIDSKRWVVGRTALPSTSKMAAGLGIDYRQFEDGSVDHSSALVLLDAQGRVVARSRDTQGLDQRFLAALRHALDAT